MVENKDISVNLWQAIRECAISECNDASYVALNMDDVTLPILADNAVEVVPFPTALVSNHENVWMSNETLLMSQDLVCYSMDSTPGVVIKGSPPSVTAASWCTDHATRTLGRLAVAI